MNKIWSIATKLFSGGLLGYEISEATREAPVIKVEAPPTVFAPPQPANSEHDLASILLIILIAIFVATICFAILWKMMSEKKQQRPTRIGLT